MLYVGLDKSHFNILMLHVDIIISCIKGADFSKYHSNMVCQLIDSRWPCSTALKGVTKHAPLEWFNKGKTYGNENPRSQNRLNSTFSTSIWSQDKISMPFVYTGSTLNTRVDPIIHVNTNPCSPRWEIKHAYICVLYMPK